MGQSDNSSTSSLSTIEERTNWEKQLNDLEEENQAHLQRIASLEAQLEEIGRDRLVDTERAIQERNQLLADLEATKILLSEAVEREEKLTIKLEQLRSSPSKSPPTNRPVSPTPKPGILPSGYCPLKSKGWAKSQRSPMKSADSALDAVDGRKIPVRASSTFIIMECLALHCGTFPLQLSRSPSLGSSEQRACRVDISVFQALNTRLKQQEQRCRELYYALQHQKQRTEQIMLGGYITQGSGTLNDTLVTSQPSAKSP